MMPENYLPQRIVSLQPSVTVTMRDLGLLDRLAACTKYCVDVCPEVRQAGCVIVEDSWLGKADQILAVRPDLVIASVPYRIESLAEIMKTGVPCLCLSPKSLADVYQDILHIARLVSSAEPEVAEKPAAEARGLTLAEQMQHEVAEVRRKAQGAGKPLVY